MPKTDLRIDRTRKWHCGNCVLGTERRYFCRSYQPNPFQPEGGWFWVGDSAVTETRHKDCLIDERKVVTG